MELGGLKIEVNTVPVTAFSDAWERHKRAGTKKIPDIPIKGQMTSEMHALMVASLSSDPNAEEQTLTIGFGGDFQFDVECVVADYEAGPMAGTLNEFTATLRPSGDGIWSTSCGDRFGRSTGGGRPNHLTPNTPRRRAYVRRSTEDGSDRGRKAGSCRRHDSQAVVEVAEEGTPGEDD
jgi:hypothetical protein